MKTSLFPAAVAAFSLLAAACGSSQHTYDFQENGCDTGTHQFATKLDYCSGLQDESLNKGCAQYSRRQEFQANCTDQTWSPS